MTTTKNHCFNMIKRYQIEKQGVDLSALRIASCLKSPNESSEASDYYRVMQALIEKLPSQQKLINHYIRLTT